MTVGSLAYRKNEAAIRRGDVPEKYLRILPHVMNADRVLEIGSAEGVLSLLMVDWCRGVIGIELREDRHAQALRLKEDWAAMGKQVGGCDLIHGDIRENLDLLRSVDTLVAVRSIYYLRDDIDHVFAAAADSGVSRVVLCGNRNRAEAYARGEMLGNLGLFNFYASIDGMTQVLTRAGYQIETTVREGDPIVVGVRH